MTYICNGEFVTGGKKDGTEKQDNFDRYRTMAEGIELCGLLLFLLFAFISFVFLHVLSSF